MGIQTSYIKKPCEPQTKPFFIKIPPRKCWRLLPHFLSPICGGFAGKRSCGPWRRPLLARWRQRRREAAWSRFLGGKLSEILVLATAGSVHAVVRTKIRLPRWVETRVRWTVRRESPRRSSKEARLLCSELEAGFCCVLEIWVWCCVTLFFVVIGWDQWDLLTKLALEHGSNNLCSSRLKKKKKKKKNLKLFNCSCCLILLCFIFSFSWCLIVCDLWALSVLVLSGFLL